MILTVTLNACIDKTYTVPFFTLDRVHRPDQMLVTPGGKGINVARVYQTLGGEAVATGFLGGSNGEYLAKSLHRDGIRDAFVRVREESRVCLQIADPVAGTMTELNEHGPTIMPDDAGALLLALEDRLPGCEMLVISGSMPPETPTGLYAQMIALAQNEFGVRAVLDLSLIHI